MGIKNVHETNEQILQFDQYYERLNAFAFLLIRIE